MHTIAQISLDIKADNLFNGFDLQQDVSRTFWLSVAPAIEKLLDDYDVKNKTLIFNRLVLDLGRIEINQWEIVLKEKIIESLSKALKKRVQEVSNATDNNPQLPEDRAPTRLSTRRHWFDTWLYFLEKGHIPNATSLPDEQTWHQAIAEILATDAQAEAQLIKLLKIDLDKVPAPSANAKSSSFGHTPSVVSTGVLARLILQFDEKLLAQIASILARSEYILLPQYRQQLMDFIKKQTAQELTKAFEISFSDVVNSYDKILFWQKTFAYIIQNPTARLSVEQIALLSFNDYINRVFSVNVFNKKNKKANPIKAWDAFLQEAKSQLPTAMHTIMPLALKQKRKEVGSTDLGSQQPSELIQDKERDKDVPKNIETEKQEAGKNQKNPNRNTTSVKDLYKNKNTPKQDKTEEQPLKQPNQKEDIPKTPFSLDNEAKPSDSAFFFIKNAGVVLVHAFLPSLFKAFDWSGEDKKFKDETLCHRAIHLLHYIASGEEQLPEYRLLLPKVLCGLPLDISIERTIVLTDIEKNEAQEMLKAVIDHWKALKNTSLEGLRQGFFERDAKLSHTEKGWLLQVESKTQDILLSQLPWGIGMIKLPWMKEMLFVEWT